MSAIKNPSRRGFLGAAVAVGLSPAVSIIGRSSAVIAAAGTSISEPTSRYRVLNRDEAAFTEAMVNALCPADDLTPDGVTSGLVTVIDRSLAGEMDAAFASSPSRAQQALFKTGLAAADRACHARHGSSLAALSAIEARHFLADIKAGKVDSDFPLAAWSHEIIDPLLTQASFAGPVYDAYGTKMFWKLFGYVTAPAQPIEHI